METSAKSLSRVLPHACNHLRYMSMSPSFAKLFGSFIPNIPNIPNIPEKNNTDRNAKNEPPSAKQRGHEKKHSQTDKDTVNTKNEHALPPEVERVCAAMNNRED